MMRDAILLDCDGVLADYVDAYRSAVFRMKGTRAVLEAVVDDWHTYKCFGLTEAEDTEIKATLNPLTFATTCWYANFLAAVRATFPRNQIIVVTAPLEGHDTWAISRARWLTGRGFDSVISTRDKHEVPGAVLVDDKESNIARWEEAQGKSGVLFPALDNRNREYVGREVSYVMQQLRRVLLT